MNSSIAVTSHPACRGIGNYCDKNVTRPRPPLSTTALPTTGGATSRFISWLVILKGNNQVLTLRLPGITNVRQFTTIRSVFRNLASMINSCACTIAVLFVASVPLSAHNTPPAPSDFKIASVADSSVSLSCSAPPGAVSYKVYYSTTGGLTPTNTPKPIVGIVPTSYTVSGLTNNT